MRNLLTSLFFLVLLLFALPVAVFAQETTTFISVRTGYSITFPDTWERHADPETMNIYAMRPEQVKNEKFREQVSVQSHEVEKGATLDTRYPALLEMLRKEYTDFKIVREGATTIFDQRAKAIAYTYTKNENSRQAMLYLLLKGQREYLVFCIATPATFERYREQFKAIVQTLRLTTPRPGATDFGFTITLPIDWEERYDEEGTGLFGISLDNEKQPYTRYFGVITDDMLDFMDVERLYLDVLKILGTRKQKMTPLGNKTVKLSGVWAKRYTYSFQLENATYQALEYLIVEKGRFFRLYTDVPQEHFAKDLPMLDAIAQSFALTPVASTSTNLLAARKGFVTSPVPNKFKADGPAPEPPVNTFKLVHYTSPAGKLAAYITPDPGDGKKHPAVLWAHGGFGGIGKEFWEKAKPENDQSASAFREAGLMLMCPSWRGENDNPGKYEMFFGEVDDLLAARDYLAQLPYVDPARIYIAGHSSGGTLTLLAAEATDKFRAAFSFGGAPDIGRVVIDGTGYDNTPYDYRILEESKLRSAVRFAGAIKRPTFYFESEESVYCYDACRLYWYAEDFHAPFEPFFVEGGDHFNILAPLTKLVAQKILQDTGETCNITITDEEVQKACPFEKKDEVEI